MRISVQRPVNSRIRFGLGVACLFKMGSCVNIYLIVIFRFKWLRRNTSICLVSVCVCMCNGVSEGKVKGKILPLSFFLYKPTSDNK